MDGNRCDGTFGCYKQNDEWKNAKTNRMGRIISDALPEKPFHNLPLCNKNLW